MGGIMVEVGEDEGEVGEEEGVIVTRIKTR